jgi:hypothetical protein
MCGQKTPPSSKATGASEEEKTMKTAIATTLAVLGIGYLGVQAQSSSTTQSRSTGAGQPITVTGCVQQASPGASSSNAFKLTDVSMGAGAKSSSDSSASSSTRSAQPAGALDEYTLSADSSVNLSQHVNHKVEITGTIANDSATSSSTTSPGAAPGSTPQDTTNPGGAMSSRSASSIGTPTLKVTSVRPIASSCQ